MKPELLPTKNDSFRPWLSSAGLVMLLQVREPRNPIKTSKNQKPFKFFENSLYIFFRSDIIFQFRIYQNITIYIYVKYILYRWFKKIKWFLIFRCFYEFSRLSYLLQRNQPSKRQPRSKTIILDWQKFRFHTLSRSKLHFTKLINFAIDFDQLFVRIFGNFWYQSIRKTRKNGFMLET